MTATFGLKIKTNTKKDNSIQNTIPGYKINAHVWVVLLSFCIIKASRLEICECKLNICLLKSGIKTFTCLTLPEIDCLRIQHDIDNKKDIFLCG